MKIHIVGIQYRCCDLVRWGAVFKRCPVGPLSSEMAGAQRRDKLSHRLPLHLHRSDSGQNCTGPGSWIQYRCHLILLFLFQCTETCCIMVQLCIRRYVARSKTGGYSRRLVAGQFGSNYSNKSNEEAFRLPIRGMTITAAAIAMMTP